MTSIPNNATMDAVPSELRQMVEQALAEGRRQLSNRGNIDAVFLVRMPDGAVERAVIPGPLNELLNSGDAKRRLFAGIRAWVKVQGVTAVAFSADTWVGLPTEKQKRMAKEDPEALRRLFESVRSLDDAIEQGLSERAEALIITVQTASDVVIVNQSYTRYSQAHRIDFGERSIMHIPQSQFRGRQKMYGVNSDADIE